MRVWIELKYVTRRASGLYYYRRRIPDDLRAHYGDKAFYVQSLKTKELSKAHYFCVPPNGTLIKY
jgi:hypothetical protein